MSPTLRASTVAAGVFALMTAVIVTTLLLSSHRQYREHGGDEGGGIEDWEHTVNLTNDECRACEAALGTVEWSKPGWDVNSPKTKATWDWAPAIPSAALRLSPPSSLTTPSSLTAQHPRGMCGFHKMRPREAREVLFDKAVLFLGNSVSRRLMYAVADTLGGKRARVNALASDLELSAKYGVQRVWDSRQHFHSFFEIPVYEGTGELGPQLTCLRQAAASASDGGGGEDGAGGGAGAGGGEGSRGKRLFPKEEATATVTTPAPTSTPWFPKVDELFGFDREANGGKGAVSDARTAASRLRCPGRGGRGGDWRHTRQVRHGQTLRGGGRGGGGWRAMRERHPTAATRLAFAYTNNPPTAVAAAALRAWAAAPPGDFQDHIGAHYDVVVVQVAQGANVSDLADAARAFAHRRGPVISPAFHVVCIEHYSRREAPCPGHHGN
jgi:hypothetical protein